MEFGKFKISEFILGAIIFVVFILGITYLTELPELKTTELKLQEFREQELKHQVELEELKSKILEENK